MKIYFDSFDDCTSVTTRIEDAAFPDDKSKDVKLLFAFRYWLPDMTK